MIYQFLFCIYILEKNIYYTVYCYKNVQNSILVSLLFRAAWFLICKLFRDLE